VGPDFVAEFDAAYTEARHSPYGSRAAADYAKGKEAHVFNPDVDPLKAAQRVLQEGQYTGTIDRADRAFLDFQEPVGERVQQGRPNVPLNGVEVKMQPDGTGGWRYHVDPRTRARAPSKKRQD
jgi:hypothetical protein